MLLDRVVQLVVDLDLDLGIVGSKFRRAQAPLYSPFASFFPFYLSISVTPITTPTKFRALIDRAYVWVLGSFAFWLLIGLLCLIPRRDYLRLTFWVTREWIASRRYIFASFLSCFLISPGGVPIPGVIQIRTIALGGLGIDWRQIGIWGR